MKKSAAIILSFVLALSLAACGNTQSQDSAAQNAPSPTEASSPTEAPSTTETPSSAPAANDNGSGDTAAAGTALSGNILITYFSVPETDGVDTEVLGNTQYIAQLIQQETGGELFRIETVQEYPGSHDPLLEYAWNERAENARPELSSQIENLDSYDVIFLGFPNWNADLPMPVYTFLEAYDFAGKTIVPFTTHGGSGFSRTIQTIMELQPEASVIENGLSISRNSVPDAQGDVTEWVAGLNL